MFKSTLFLTSLMATSLATTPLAVHADQLVTTPALVREHAPATVNLQPAFSPTQGPRLRFEGLDNARELGGYVVKSGQTIQHGKLLRSDSLDRLTAADMAKLKQQFGLAIVIDLRTTEQITKKPDKVIEGVRYVQYSVLGTRSNYDGDDPGMYRDMALQPAALTAYRGILKTIAHAQGQTVLFHCSHGMDRTGMVALLLMTILGANDNDIMHDYLLSNTALNVKWAEPALLNSAKQLIIDRYGSLATYIDKILGVTSAEQAAIRQHYLTPLTKPQEKPAPQQPSGTGQPGSKPQTPKPLPQTPKHPHKPTNKPQSVPAQQAAPHATAKPSTPQIKPVTINQKQPRATLPATGEQPAPSLIAAGLAVLTTLGLGAYYRRHVR